MPAFQRVSTPLFSPTQCATCMTHSDPEGFIDLLAEFGPPHGRLYMCAGCVYQAGKEAGMLAPKEAQDLVRRLAEAAAMISSLESELALEKENKLLTVQAAKSFLNDYAAASIRHSTGEYDE